jgi:hypothetical protein
VYFLRHFVDFLGFTVDAASRHDGLPAQHYDLSVRYRTERSGRWVESGRVVAEVS